MSKATWCILCLGYREIFEEVEEQIGYEEQARQVWVTRLDCGHEYVAERRFRDPEQPTTVELLNEIDHLNKRVIYWRDSEARSQRARADEAEARLDAVRAIHRKATGGNYCLGCWEAGGEDGAPSWPCPTIAAVDGTYHASVRPPRRHPERTGR